MKSADWQQNRPHPLKAWNAQELAQLPTYYVMERGKGMAETVAPEMPSREQISACRWLPDAELSVYSSEFERTGFQGGLQWYRCGTSETHNADLQLFAGRAIDVPSLFVAGASDWGAYQRPGAFERMQTVACTRLRGCHFIDGAGHWVQQEQPGEVAGRILKFLSANRAAGASGEEAARY
jgi:pimeloyl-ACP methyl ester carboxylesterase